MALPFRDKAFYGDDEIAQLGCGTYGRVFLTEKGYAIKEMENEDNLATQSTLHEIVSLLKVTSPYVIPLIDVIIEEDDTSLVLPLAAASLKDVIANTTLNIPELATQLCYAVATIHNANLLHLDIKPENILLQDKSYREIWLADLGISRIHTCAFPPLQETFFSLWYRSPEIILGGPVTAKGDVWAVGLVLVEMFLSRQGGKRKVLFPGDSPLEQLYMMFRLLGTPETGILTTLPNWKTTFPKWSRRLESFLSKNGLSKQEIDVVSFILNLDYTQRPTIFEVFQHPYFSDVEIPEELTCLESLRLYSHHPDIEDVAPFMTERRNVVLWMLEIGNKKKLQNETYSLAVYLLDRMISLGKFIKTNLGYIGLACMYIAITFYESKTLSPKTLINLTGSSFEIPNLEQEVNNILIKTSFDLAPATSYFFLSRHLLQNQVDGQIALLIWKASLATLANTLPPEDTFNAILVLADNTIPLTKDAKNLREEILDLETNRREIKLAQELVRTRV